VSNTYLGRIIGKGGEMVRDLQSRSGASIQVDQTGSKAGKSALLKPIHVKGLLSEIDIVLQCISRLACENGSKPELPMGRCVSKLSHIPSNKAGILIGPQGNTIKALQDDFKVRIQVKSTDEPDGTREVRIVGVAMSVDKCEVAIKALLDGRVGTNMSSHMPSSMPSNMPSNMPSSNMPMHMPSMGPPNMNVLPKGIGRDAGAALLSVPLGRVGAIIGKGGDMIKKLQQGFNVSIQIDQKTDAARDIGIVAIKGTDGTGNPLTFGVQSCIEEIWRMIHDTNGGGGRNMPLHGGSGGPPMGYGGPMMGGPPQGYGRAPPMGFGGPPMGFGGPPHGYGGPPHGFGGPPHGYGGPPQQQYPPPQQQYPPQQGGYGQYQPPPGQKPPGQNGAPPPYGAPPAQYTPPNAYGAPPGQQQQQFFPPPAAPAPAPVAAPAPAPSEWAAATAPDGKTYYYHTKTNQTTWTKPAGMP
jgi:rRNA processing protein Krr1/Pno1